jgi:hypothetical protein
LIIAGAIAMVFSVWINIDLTLQPLLVQARIERCGLLLFV